MVMSKYSKNSRWSEEEVCELKRLYSQGFMAKEIGERLRKDKLSVQRKIFRLGITKPTYWNNKEVEILKNNYYNTSRDELLRLLPNRSFESIKTKARVLGLKRINNGNTSWTDKEIEQLKHFFKEGLIYEEIAIKIGKTKSSIVQKLGDIKVRQKYPRVNWWNKDEIDNLVKLYKYKTITELDNIFTRHSKDSIRIKAKDLGLLGQKRSYRKWSNEDYILLEKLYQDGYDTNYIADKLDRDYLPVNLKLKPIRGKDLFWRNEDLDLLRNNYSIATKEELIKMFPKRKYYSISSKAREIGLSRPLNLLWSEDEVSILVKNYPNKTIKELIILLPDKSKNQIINKSKTMKLKKNKETLARCLRVKYNIDYEEISFSHEKNTRWRYKILKRDNYICQECGLDDDSGQGLHAHHIVPQRDCDDGGKYDINNGITLCIECHKKTINKEYKYANKYKSIIR